MLSRSCKFRKSIILNHSVFDCALISPSLYINSNNYYIIIIYIIYIYSYINSLCINFFFIFYIFITILISESMMINWGLSWSNLWGAQGQEEKIGWYFIYVPMRNQDSQINFKEFWIESYKFELRKAVFFSALQPDPPGGVSNKDQGISKSNRHLYLWR